MLQASLSPNQPPINRDSIHLELCYGFYVLSYGEGKLEGTSKEVDNLVFFLSPQLKAGLGWGSGAPFWQSASITQGSLSDKPQSKAGGKEARIHL